MVEPSSRRKTFQVGHGLADVWAPILSGQAFRVYVMYCFYRNSKTGDAYPSISTLKKKLSMGTEQVMDAIKELVYYGFLSPVEWDNKKHNKYSINEIPEIIVDGDRSYVRNDAGLQPFLRWERFDDSSSAEKEKRLKKLIDTRKSKPTNRSERRNVPTVGTMTQTVPNVGTMNNPIVPNVGTELLEDKEKTENKEKNIPSESNSECSTARETDAEKTVSTLEPFEPEIPQNQSNGASPTDPADQKPIPLHECPSCNLVDMQNKCSYLARFYDAIEPIIGHKVKKPHRNPCAAVHEHTLAELVRAAEYNAAKRYGEADPSWLWPNKFCAPSVLEELVTNSVAWIENGRPFVGKLKPGEKPPASKADETRIAQKWKAAVLGDIENGYYRPELEAEIDRLVLLDNDTRFNEITKFRTEKA